MTSQVGICNIALVALGAATIMSIDDKTKSATTLKAVYDAQLDAELSAHPWQFAITRALLPASATPPAYEWPAAYLLPSDFLKLVLVGDLWCFYNPDWPSFTVEGNAILTDAAAPLPVRYVRRITSAGSLAPLFVEAFALRLAAKVCETLTQSLPKKQALQQEYVETIRRAKRSNDIQLPPQRTPPSSWELSLYQGEG